MSDTAREATSMNEHLDLLRRQYFALYPIRLIKFHSTSSNGANSLYKHQDWIYRHVLGSHYQPANDYQRKFLKGLIDAIETDLRSEDALAEEWELDDRLMDRYSELLCRSSANTANLTPDPSFKTYLYNHNGKENSITLFEAQTTIEAGSTGLRTWTASLFLAEVLLNRPDLLKRPDHSSASGQATFLPVLELGSGTGFLSIFLSQMGCPTIWSSDIGDEEISSENEEEMPEGRLRDDETIDESTIHLHADSSNAEKQYTRLISQTARRGPLDSLIANIRLNKLAEGSKVIPIRLDWLHSMVGEGSEDKRSEMIKMSQKLPAELVLLATDVIYDPDLVRPLVSTIELFLRHPPPAGEMRSRSALIAATVRNKDTLQMFKDVCLTTSLHLETIDIRRENVPTVFWNASTWEGSEVELMQLTIGV